jgi:hypothetical protein
MVALRHAFQCLAAQNIDNEPDHRVSLMGDSLDAAAAELNQTADRRYRCCDDAAVTDREMDAVVGYQPPSALD